MHVLLTWVQYKRLLEHHLSHELIVNMRLIHLLDKRKYLHNLPIPLILQQPLRKLQQIFHILRVIQLQLTPPILIRVINYC